MSTSLVEMGQTVLIKGLSWALGREGEGPLSKPAAGWVAVTKWSDPGLDLGVMLPCCPSAPAHLACLLLFCPALVPPLAHLLRIFLLSPLAALVMGWMELGVFRRHLCCSALGPEHQLVLPLTGAPCLPGCTLPSVKSQSPKAQPQTWKSASRLYW